MGPLLNFKDQIQRRNKREDKKKKLMEFSQLRGNVPQCLERQERKE